MKIFFMRISGIFAILLLFAALPAMIYAQGIEGCSDNNPTTVCKVVDPSCQGVTNSSLCGSNSSQTIENNSVFGPNGIMTKIARIIALIVGVAAVIMIIIGGIQYIIASGDPTNITNAKNTILYAIIGLVVAVAAQGIITFVLIRL